MIRYVVYKAGLHRSISSATGYSVVVFHPWCIFPCYLRTIEIITGDLCNRSESGICIAQTICVLVINNYLLLVLLSFDVNIIIIRFRYFIIYRISFKLLPVSIFPTVILIINDQLTVCQFPVIRIITIVSIYFTKVCCKNCPNSSLQ